MLKDIKPLIPELINMVKEASSEILRVYEGDFNVNYKDDRSPLTEADRRSHRIIYSTLRNLTPETPVLSEEGSNIEYSERSRWKEFWLVDPLDGTKEFIKRNGEFTVNIALIQENRPVFGIISIPVKGLIYYGGTLAGGIFRYSLKEEKADYLDNQYRIEPDRTEKHTGLRVVGSRSHGSERLRGFIERLKEQYKNLSFVSAGSALKFCLVAEGKADLYPRFAPTMEWDTAAGQAILRSAGIKVLRADNLSELTYNKESLKNPDFIVARKGVLESITSFVHEYKS
ncbi:MAG: 3'(2'),5'-bisphosphate nucleotidase [Nitrospirae bacterium]|nr:MAG: 3'(2'),5'-bisphosphate nucleotidase [Nitrospirota bacterium]